MAASAGIHLIAAAGSIAATKPHNRSIFFTSLRLETKHSCPRSSLCFLLPPSIISLSSHRRRLFTSSSSAATKFSEDLEEEDAFAEHRGNEEPEQQQQRDYSPRSRSIESRRLYVGNLPFTTTSSELSEIFSQAGKIDQVEVNEHVKTHMAHPTASEVAAPSNGATYARSKGTAKLTIPSNEDPATRLSVIIDQESQPLRMMVMGRPLRLNLASDKAKSAASSLVEASATSEGSEIGVDQESSLKSNLV